MSSIYERYKIDHPEGIKIRSARLYHEEIESHLLQDIKEDKKPESKHFTLDHFFKN